MHSKKHVLIESMQSCLEVSKKSKRFTTCTTQILKDKDKIKKAWEMKK